MVEKSVQRLGCHLGLTSLSGVAHYRIMLLGAKVDGRGMPDRSSDVLCEPRGRLWIRCDSVRMMGKPSGQQTSVNAYASSQPCDMRHGPRGLNYAALSGSLGGACRGNLFCRRPLKQQVDAWRPDARLCGEHR